MSAGGRCSSFRLGPGRSSYGAGSAYASSGAAAMAAVRPGNAGGAMTPYAHPYHPHQYPQQQPPPQHMDFPADDPTMGDAESVALVPTDPFDPRNQVTIRLPFTFSGTHDSFSTQDGSKQMQHVFPPKSILTAVRNQLSDGGKVRDPNSKRERLIGPDDRYVVVKVKQTGGYATKARHPVAWGIKGLSGGVVISDRLPGNENQNHTTNTNPMGMIPAAGAPSQGSLTVYKFPEHDKAISALWGVHDVKSLLNDVTVRKHDNFHVIPWNNDPDAPAHKKNALQIVMETVADDPKNNHGIEPIIAAHYDRVDRAEQYARESGTLLDPSVHAIAVPPAIAQKLMQDTSGIVEALKTHSFGDPITGYIVRPDGHASNSTTGTAVDPNTAKSTMASPISYHADAELTLGLLAHVRDMGNDDRDSSTD